MRELVPDNIIVGGHRLACGRHGQGEPVVLVHGTPFFSFIWRGLVPALVDAGYAVHLYDLLGFGYSERPQSTHVDTSVSGQLPVLLELLDHWGLDATHVVAHDIGGGVAQQLGIYHPGRVKSITLIDCVSFDSWPSARTRQQMAEGLDKLLSAPAETHREHFREWLYSAVHHSESMSNGQADTYLDMICGPVGQASLFQHQIMHYDPIHTSKLEARLGELGQHPVQLLWGRNDAWQVTDWAERLSTAIPGSTLTVIDDCGHQALEDQPQQVTQHVLKFLDAQR